MRSLAAMTLVAVLATGCATQTYLIDPQATAAKSKPTADKMQNFFISGLGQTQELDAAAICNGASNVMKVETEHSVINGLLGFISSGIYTPRQARVYCR